MAAPSACSQILDDLGQNNDMPCRDINIKVLARKSSCMWIDWISGRCGSRLDARRTEKEQKGWLGVGVGEKG
jgi:hypothetical protein